MRIQFTSYAKYLEVWGFLKRVGWGFTCNNDYDDLWIEPVFEGDPEDDYVITRINDMGGF